jgi:hypothetical protein
LPVGAKETSIWASSPDDIWLFDEIRTQVHHIVKGEASEPFDLVTMFPSPSHRSANGIISPIWGTSATDIWIHAEAHYDGTHWSKDRARYADDISNWALWGSSPDRYFLVEDQTLFTFDGNTWTQNISALAEGKAKGSYLTAIHGTGPDDIHVVGSIARLFHFDGMSWSKKPSPASEALLYGVWAKDRQNAYAVGCYNETNHGLLFRWNGVEWLEEESPSKEELSRVTGCDNHLYVATQQIVYERSFLPNGDLTPWAVAFETSDETSDPSILVHSAVVGIFCVNSALMVSEVKHTAILGQEKDMETTLWVR